MHASGFQFVLNPPPDELPAAEPLDEPWSVQDWSSCLNWAGHTTCLFISIQIHTYPYISHIHTYPYIISIHNIIYIYISMYISHLVWCFNIFKCWHQKHPDALLIIVPSHLQRRSFAEQWLRKAGAVFRGLLKAVTSAYVHNLCVYIYIYYTILYICVYILTCGICDTYIYIYIYVYIQ